MSDQILTRLEQVERRLANVERALGVVREPVRPPVAPPATASVPPPAPARQVVPTREHPPPPPRRPAREIDWSVAFGPKGLAVAGIGLLGAMVTPALLIFDTGLTTVGTGFVALVLAAAAAVAVVLRWRHLLVAAAT